VAKRPFDLLDVGIGGYIQKGLGRHDHAWRPKPALDGSGERKRFPDKVGIFRGSQPLDRDHPGASGGLSSGTVAVIGFCNIHRSNDGFAYYVINPLDRRLRLKPLSEDDTGVEELRGKVDFIFLSELHPEIMNILAGYQQVIFVDAQVWKESGG
jgi:hypothetical protein